MKIEVRVKPGSKTAAVEKRADGTFLVRVKERAVEGQANQAVIEAVAEYFDVPKSLVKIIRGQTNRNKILEWQER